MNVKQCFSVNNFLCQANRFCFLSTLKCAVLLQVLLFDTVVTSNTQNSKVSRSSLNWRSQKLGTVSSSVSSHSAKNTTGRVLQCVLSWHTVRHTVGCILDESDAKPFRESYGILESDCSRIPPLLSCHVVPRANQGIRFSFRCRSARIPKSDCLRRPPKQWQTICMVKTSAYRQVHFKKAHTPKSLFTILKNCSGHEK